jgi:AraC-like DNA-binding protein
MTGLSVALLRPLAELLDRLELDGAGMLTELAIRDDTAAETYIAGELVDRLLEQRAARSGDLAFGLTLARASLVRPLGLFGHMVWLSGTVRDALSRAARYFAMISRRTTLTLIEHDGRATLRQSSVPGAARGKILTDLAFGSLALRARAATGGRFAASAVRFTHVVDPAAHAAYRDVFAAPVSFGAAADELEIDAEHLALPLSTADPITSAALETKAAQLAATAHNPFLERVRRAAAAHLGGPVSLAVVAKDLGVSARTLRRYLEQERASLRTIVDDVRRARADELLAAGAPVKEIAFALGFSEPSAFSRAYKRWTGRAPKL